MSLLKSKAIFYWGEPASSTSVADGTWNHAAVQTRFDGVAIAGC